MRISLGVCLSALCITGGEILYKDLAFSGSKCARALCLAELGVVLKSVFDIGFNISRLELAGQFPICGHLWDYA